MILKPGRDKSVRHRHPWIFSGAIDRINGDPQSGETVDVRDASGEWLGRAAYSPVSQIRARLWTWDAAESVDEGFFRARIQRALDLRRAVVPAGETNACRLIHGESDGLPGLVVDRYADWLVVQVLSSGAEFQRDLLVRLLAELSGSDQIYERSDVDVRALEGLPDRTGVLRGSPPPVPLWIEENGLRFGVDLIHGQKTGFYLDQRANRRRVGQLAERRSVLNCFCYTGGFSLYALQGGAQDVLSVDASAEALELGRQNLAANALPGDKAEWLQGDVFQVLRGLRDRARKFDLIVLDPPKFAPTAAQAEKAARGYKDINLLAFKLLNPGGILATFSCSGGVSTELFQKIVAGAALDAGVDARIIDLLRQGPDHPVALNFPEGAYLKGIICQI
ncbi:class I SAM-dependent rRNA methyltransferase [bacterium]|nr:MAG: class I SAM-dependent rRNA methyltransferase [bacterium]